MLEYPEKRIDIPQIYFPRIVVAWIVLSILVYPESKSSVLGVMDIFTRSDNHENGFLEFGKGKVKSYLSNMKQNDSTELLAFSNFRKNW